MTTGTNPHQKTGNEVLLSIPLNPVLTVATVYAFRLPHQFIFDSVAYAAETGPAGATLFTAGAVGDLAGLVASIDLDADADEVFTLLQRVYAAGTLIIFTMGAATTTAGDGGAITILGRYDKLGNLTEAKG